MAAIRPSYALCRMAACVVTLAPLLALSGCLGGGFDGVSGAGQPRLASWRCDGGTRMRVERRGSSVRVISPRGEEVVLPASPPGQNSRYGASPYALVFDGREALWFAIGKRPLTCRR